MNKLKVKNTIIEKDKVAGGLLISFQINNFVFPKNFEKIGAINAAMALPMIIATNKNFDPTKLKVFPKKRGLFFS